jgi:GNAT superfamily N-acetyltransferase
VGAQRKLVEMYRRLALADVDEDEYDRLLTDAQEHADGYSLVQWRTTAPDKYLEDLAVLEGKLSTDVPFDDLAWEPEVYDAQRMRGREATVTGRGMRQFTTAVRHDASHQLVGTSTITLMSTMSEHAQQWETIVLEEHRGHRLGMLLKIENLRFARREEPQLRYIDTVNADSNGPMLRVNLALGFEPVRSWAEWELAL